MKCITCKDKFTTKYTKRCPLIPSNLCLQCCLEGKGSHSCDLRCPQAKFPLLKTFPLTNSVVGMSPTGETEGTTEEFIPRAFHFISCAVSKITVTHKSLNILNVSVEFSIQGNPSLVDTCYVGEGWKLMHLERLLKATGQIVNYSMAPTFVCFTAPGLRIIPNSTEVFIDGNKQLVVTNNTAELVGLPDCYPPLTEKPKPQNEKYSFFSAKASVFYTPFILNKSYQIKFQIEALAFFYELGFLFPYRFVEVKNLITKSELSYELSGTKTRLIIPFREDSFPPKQEYEWNRLEAIPSELPPMITRADPFRSQPMVGGNVTSEKIIPPVGIAFNKIDNYSAIQTLSLIRRPKDKELIYTVNTTESALPIRIYEQMQKLPKYRDFLIAYDLFNLNSEPLELELSSQIKGYTDEAIDNITIPAYGGREQYHLNFSQTPKLKRGLLSKISSATEATLQFQIYKKDKGRRKLLERGTRTIKFLPQDMMIWAVADPKSSNIYDLSKMLGAWITTNDSKGLLDKARSGAAKYHPNNILQGEQGDTSLEEKTLQVKALYDYLNSKLKVKYVNQPFAFDFNAGGQRVLTPERVLTIKAGNCIDLVVLFSSLMEGLGINPLIMLMPNHAFLAWGNKYKTSEMGFLECTVLGSINPNTQKKYTFEEANEKAKETFKKDFLFKSEDDYIPLRSLTMTPDKCFIVDLEEIRREGIFRI